MYEIIIVFCSKQFRMMRRAKHNEAAVICDKVVFSEVTKLGSEWLCVMYANKFLILYI
jgi:hypothetical protein